MPLTDRKELNPTTNKEPSKREPIAFVDKTFSRIDIFATKGDIPNSGTVWVGFAGTSALAGKEAGSPLNTGDSYVFHDVNLKDLYVAGQNDGDAILYNATD